MGFVPIFITLGGFVSLFALLVHYNMGVKKKRYLAILADLHVLLGHSPTTPLPLDLKALEGHYQRMRVGTAIRSEDLEKVRLLLQDAKRERHNYMQLIQTKPYAFVAKLFGHRAI
ncbi:MAG: hypothetical protein JJU34_03220 [Lunatimonas sp.]|uniref:hypothetical protein n=1 Tax=Lunatimonas sp. TaxID=2060141 RepID=UPI00263B5A02|nr:hypothetical protein [Lunatimonas sp.]MCC5936273.1 hypothetical protein [Lunatimonas sp.]